MEIEFRDGMRVVPEYLANLMGGIETHRYTYEQVIQMVNNGMVNNALFQKQTNMISKHFKDNQ